MNDPSAPRNGVDLRPATAARDRGISKAPLIIVAMNEWPSLADSLEGVRSVGAVKWCQFTAGNGCEGPQPSRPQSTIVAMNGWAIADDSLGVRSVGAVK